MVHLILLDTEWYLSDSSAHILEYVLNKFVKIVVVTLESFQFVKRDSPSIITPQS